MGIIPFLCSSIKKLSSLLSILFIGLLLVELLNIDKPPLPIGVLFSSALKSVLLSLVFILFFTLSPDGEGMGEFFDANLLLFLLEKLALSLIKVIFS
jgi:hypothetical protein